VTVITTSARAGYSRWAGTYGPETVVSALENESVRTLALPERSRALLDVGCGTARRLDGVRSDYAVGVDLTLEMLARAGGSHDLAAADARALPFPDASFDRVWCRLVIGHIPECEQVYAELSRVCAPNGYVVVTDFHADAVSAGHRRTFRDASGVRVELEHHVHPSVLQQAAAVRNGLELVFEHDAVVGPFVEAMYREAGVPDAYEAQRGLALVLSLVFRRSA